MLFVIEYFIIKVLIERIIKCRARLAHHFFLLATITLMLYLSLCFGHYRSHRTLVILFRFHNKKIYLAYQKQSLCLSLLI